MKRRQFVELVGVSCVTGLAGCGGDGVAEPDGQADESTPKPGGDSGAEDGGGSGADESSGGTADPGGSGDGGATEGGGQSGSAASYGEAVAFESSYAMEGEFENPETGESGTFSGRFAGGNGHIEFEASGQRTEMYFVDGTTYMVARGQCTVLPSGNGGSDVAPSVDVRSEVSSADEAARQHPDLQPAGTTTIDGEPVNIYEIDDSGGATYYISQSTGYPRRIETGYGQMDFHSWGDVDPISAPDMSCQSLEGI